MEIRDRVALVTGGAHRIGGAISLALAAAGADVYVHHNRSAAAAGALVDEIGKLGRRAVAGAHDLSDPHRAEEMITAATTALGPVSVLVNAASGFPADTLADVTVEELRRTLDLTLLAPVAATQAFAAMLPEGMGGAVVNITDAKLDTPYLRHFGYMVAKGGLDAFTRAAAVALAPRIRVNAVAPGVVLPPSGADDDYVTLISRNVVLPSPGGAETVAAAVCALILNDFVTGETIRVDGGAHLT